MTPVPVGDEAAHLLHAFEMRQALAASSNWLEGLGRLLLGGDAYPNGLYAWAQPALGGGLSVDRARSAQLWLTIVHLVAAIWIGKRIWGRPAALVYGLLACFGPLALAYTPVFLVDVALAAWVGVALLFLERTDGFQRPAAAAGFSVAAALALLTKWTALVWLAIPVVVAVALAVRRDSRPAWKGVAGALGVVLGGSGLVILAGQSATVSAVHPWGPMGLTPLLLVAGGLALACAWAFHAGRRRARSPVATALVSLGSILLMAGPWYALKWQDLLGRLAHESSTTTQVAGPSMDAIQQFLDTARELVPGAEVLLVLGLCLAFWGKRGRLNAVVRICGGLLGLWLTVRHLPFNARYLLPMGPLLAGACVVAWKSLPSRAQWGGAFAVAVWIMVVNQQSDQAPFARAQLTRAQVSALVDALDEGCESERCQAHYGPQVPGLQGRGLRVLAATRGIDLQVMEDGAPPPGQSSPPAVLVLGGGNVCEGPGLLQLNSSGHGPRLSVCSNPR